MLSIIFLALITALLNLQIVQYEKYKRTAENNFLRIKINYPIRGEIYDCNFESIAVNKSSYNLYISPGKIKDKKKVVKFVSENFSLKSEKVDKIIYNNRFRLFQEILLVQNIKFDDMIKASEVLNYYPSLFFKNEAIREYKYPNHFSGYIGRINEKEYGKLQEEGYSINSFLGKNGLEKFYEATLRGKNGYKIVQVDASGKNLQFFKHNLDRPAIDGSDLVLTIDNRLQNYISSIFPENKNGAIIVMNTKTGGILSYVSKPDFDLNIFSNNIATKDWNELINNPNKPMLDRAILGTYPPGSVYKPLTAILGLEKGLIQEDTKLAECKGGLTFGERYFKCWWEEGHGALNVTDAIKYSCDVFFYDLSTKFSLEDFEEYSKKWKLHGKTGIDLPSERAGFFPTRKWYVDNYGKYVGILGQKVNLAIGQGEILTTPLQICAFYTALANHGSWLQPHFLMKTISSKQTDVVLPNKIDIQISDNSIEIIEDALYKVVNTAYGTGSNAKISEATVFGKTGSAENHMGEKTHAWFAGYTNCEKDNIAFVVFLENAGHGGSIAAPLAKKIVNYYLKL